MKKAWPHIKCVLFIVVLAVVILVCDYLFAESGYIRFVLNDVNSSNESYDTIVLGASHTRCSIDTEYLDKYMNVNSFNMGIPGETVDDFYYVLKSVVDSGNNVKQVIVDVDYYYWMNGQSQNHFSKSFIYQQMKDTWVKAEYLWNNRAELDIRNVFSRRLTWKCTIKKAKTNIALKKTKEYKNYDMSAGLDTDGYFATAGGPYLGKGFCYRYRINEVPGNPSYVNTMKGNAAKSLDKTVISQFERFLDYCNDNDIKVVCVSTPITPDAFKEAQVDRASEKLKELFDSYNIKYYDFNKTLMSETVRAGIKSVDAGQEEGALAMGMSHFKAMLYIIVPQALKNVIPEMCNTFVNNLKMTSVLNVIGVSELFLMAKTAGGAYYKYFESYIVISIIYFVLCFVFNRIFAVVEKKLQGRSDYELATEFLDNE